MSVVNLYQVSLVAAFAAGMVALFAPCCISFLLPSYFGNIFKERKRVILMTLVYSLGIFTVMLPIVLGAKALSLFFFRYHDQSYLAGGIFLLVVAGLTLMGIKLPMPHLTLSRKGSEIDVWSTYVLGVFSGITSACCAPVLLGVMSLSLLSQTLIGSLGVGLAYVLGMVFPLYVASLLLERGNVLEKPILRKKIGEIRLGGKQFVIFVSNIVGAAIFLIMGGVTTYLAVSGGLGMPEADEFARGIAVVADKVSGWSKGVPFVDAVFAVAMGVFLAKLIEKALRKKGK